jgi:hypothetical protein
MSVDRDRDWAEANESASRTVLQTAYICEACGSPSSFDGLGGEWCPRCESSEHLAKRQTLYRLVDVQLQ